MKKTTLKLISITLLLNYACNSKMYYRSEIYTQQHLYNWDSYFKVYKIDSINTYYLIYAKNKSELYKIVSKKEVTQNCNQIQVNHLYSFNLESIWRKQILMGKINVSPSENPHINCLYFDDSTLICVERDSINDLYKAKNLNGLCLINN